MNRILPNELKIGPYDFDVVDVGEGINLGQCHTSKGLINIDTTRGKFLVEASFMHEILRGVYWAYGLEDDDKEERTVNVLSSGLIQVFRDNPEVGKYFLE